MSAHFTRLACVRTLRTTDSRCDEAPQAMAGQVAMSTPPAQVDNFLSALAEEHGLETKMALPNAGVKQAQPAAAEPAAVEDSFEARLNALRGA